jgi:hypothetical protein
MNKADRPIYTVMCFNNARIEDMIAWMQPGVTPPSAHGWDRLMGFYYHRKEAVDAVLHPRADIWEYSYSWVLVEGKKPGVYGTSTSETWFHWETDESAPFHDEHYGGGYKECPRPDIGNITSITMG